MNEYYKNPFNYIGAKYKLLSQILPLFPDNITTFVDMFGGSAVAYAWYVWVKGYKGDTVVKWIN